MINDKLSIKQARAETPEKLHEDLLTRICNINPELNALIEVFDDQTTKIASGPLGGVPIVIKDNIVYKDHVSSAGAKILENYVGSYTATALSRLIDKGAYVLGRANMDDSAMGSSTESSIYGPTLNPLDKTRVPGGSSGGSAAAVAAGLVPIALGTDTAGSIRQPASMCGVVGMKGTYGAVSRYGAIAMGSSLDQIGPIANTVSDAELVFNIMRGEDEYDLTTIPDSDWEKADQIPVPNQWVIGVPWNEIEVDGIDQHVLKNFKTTIDKLKDRGVEIREVELPTMKYSLPAYYIIMPAEVSSNLGRYDGIKYGLSVEGKDLIDGYFQSRKTGFGTEVQRRILLGTYVLSAGYYDSYYGQALKVREAITRELLDVFASGVHAIAMPTTPGPAFKLGEKTTDPVQMYLEDIFTIPANITQTPAISVPNGLVDSDNSRLPTGFQLMCPHLRDQWCFDLGKIIEEVSK